MSKETAVNSAEWWEQYFQNAWLANDGPAQTRYFMERLLASLDEPERSFLESAPHRILDWGCAMGDGVDVLATALPKSTVIGLDSSFTAIGEARKTYPNHEFLHSEFGEIEGQYDAVFTSNCLEHFAYPLELMESHARSSRHLYVVLVPFNEYPLLDCHRSQFREESFPDRLRHLRQLKTKVLDDLDARYWAGEQLLVVYGSDELRKRRRQQKSRMPERDKWDDYYASLPLNEEDENSADFNREFVTAVSEVLDPESRVLEAGSGGGWQSLALARAGYDVTLLDFSDEALAYSKGIFSREGLSANFVREDALEPNRDSFDLVFNAGVLEHYSFEEQVRFLRGMSSRSAKFVLVLVPSSSCYWYWVWRLQMSASGDWAWGKEVPAYDLSTLFAAAGLHFIGHRYMGDRWTEHFIAASALEEPLRSNLLEIHRSPLLSSEQKGYLIAALGTVEGFSMEAPPKGWQTAATNPERQRTAELTAALADALSLQLQTSRQLARLDADLGRSKRLESSASRSDAAPQPAPNDEISNQERIAEITKLRHEIESRDESLLQLSKENARLREMIDDAEDVRQKVLDGLRNFTTSFDASLCTYRNQRAWQVMLLIRKLYSNLVREGWPGKREFVRFWLRLPLDGIPPLGRYDLSFPTPLPQMPLALSEQVGYSAASDGEDKGKKSHVSTPIPEPYDVIVLPVFEFDFRFQRPQQLALEFGRNGRRVYWISPSRTAPEDDEKPYLLVPLADNVWEVRLQSIDKNIYQDELSDGDADSAANLLQQMHRDLGLSSTAAIIELPFWRRLGLALRRQLNSRLVFDCMDDWNAFPNVGSFNSSEQALLVQEADLLIVTSKLLYQRYANAGLSPILVRNGVDLSKFTIKRGQGELETFRKPLVGYAGAIADWFDYGLLCEAARLRPDYSFVLVGGYGLEQTLAAKVASYFEGIPNIYPIGHKSHEKLPDLVNQFDVCMIPFVINAVTEATDPVKMYEYLALGKPTVATKMPELAQCAELLYTADDVDEFVAKIDLALAEPEALKERRIEFAAANTWAHRYRAMDRAMIKAFDLVSIVIVTHNSGDYLELCLDSVASETAYPNLEVIVVDNASSDGSRKVIEKYVAQDRRIKVKLLDENVGFAAANNVGVTSATGRFIVLLNPDTIVTRNWLAKLMSHGGGKTGLVSPVTNWAGNEIRINVNYQDRESMDQFAEALASRRQGEELHVEMVPLFCTLIPREVWDDVGPLDERFSIGMFEDDDYCLRVRRAGYDVVVAEDCFIHHFGNGSFSQIEKARYQAIFEQNREQFEGKWNITWRPHSYRPGVFDEHVQFSPTDFN